MTNGDIKNAAQAIADALVPPTQTASVGWRWGTVGAVNNDGTVDVEIAGTVVPSVIVATHVYAHVGDRVRVMWQSTGALVDAIYTAGPSQPLAVENGGTGSTGTDRTLITYDGTKATPNADSFDIWKWGRCVGLSVVDLTILSSLANNGTVVVGTVPAGYRPYKYWYFASYTPGVVIRITTGGELRVHNKTGSSLAANTKVAFSTSYPTN